MKPVDISSAANVVLVLWEMCNLLRGEDNLHFNSVCVCDAMFNCLPREWDFWQAAFSLFFLNWNFVKATGYVLSVKQ